MTDKLVKALKLYDETFEGSFPTIPLMANNPPEKVVEIIHNCISAKKDVYEMGYLELNDIQY